MTLLLLWTVRSFRKIKNSLFNHALLTQECGPYKVPIGTERSFYLESPALLAVNIENRRNEQSMVTESDLL